MIVELIKGISLDAVHTIKGRKNFTKAYEKMGMILAKIHNLNACVGDCKPENIFETKEKNLFILDFDQFRYFKDFSENMLTGQLWDFHEFLFYLGHFFPNSKHPFLPKLIHAFHLGYFKKRKRNKTFGKFLLKIGSPKYIWSYIFFLNPFTLKFIYDLVISEKKQIIKSLAI